MISEGGFHYVLVNRKSDKRASRKDQGHLAIFVKASELDADGLGGGIVSILTAHTPQEKAVLQRIMRSYRVNLVRIRAGNLNFPPIRLKIRSAFQNDKLVSELKALFESDTARYRGPHYQSAKAFARWFQLQIADEKSPARALLKQRAPDLLEYRRGERWFGDQISTRRKMQS